MSGKKILIWGYGLEGKSTERFLRNFCQPESITIYEGKLEGICRENFDYIIKSPGIIMQEEDPRFTSQTELFLRQFRSQVIGVTGTKGKSTTSSMLYTVLKACCNRNVVLLGNIGLPCLNYYEDITEDTIIVYEMSCHQLAHTRVSPHIAIFLNLFEEHLDYYGTLDNYFQAKYNITRYQKPEDFFLTGENVPTIATQAQAVTIQKEHSYHLRINGMQNEYNAEFVFYVAVTLFGLAEKEVLHQMEQFQGLPHRLEHVGTINGVRYYDDSISTIPEATICAINSIDNVQTVLIGGKDRNINYDSLIHFIGQNPDITFICMYASGKRIYESVNNDANCHYTEDLQGAVQMAKALSPKGSACLLSPAAASYGYFKNFEERGDAFKKLIAEPAVKDS